jgi:hypothetical protein
MARAEEIALLTMLRCDSVAPLGAPVVPEVNWMLIGSSGLRLRPMASRRERPGLWPMVITASKP